MSDTAKARYCRRCDYDLSASAGPVCPECGKGFSPTDPSSFRRYSRRSWRGRLRRWRWPIAATLLLILLWPREWVFIQTDWLDPAATSTVRAKALCVGGPWWCGGAYPPIVWSASGGPEPTLNAASKYVMFDVGATTSRGPLLLRGEFNNSKVAVLPPAPADLGDQWPQDIRGYVRSIARETASGQIGSESVVIHAPNPPWFKAR